MSESVRGSSARPRAFPRALRAPVLAGASTLAVHLLIAAAFPAARFLKYTAAGRFWVDGAMPHERLVDFSPLFLSLAILFERLALPSFALLQAMEMTLAAISAALLYVLVERRHGPRVATVTTAAFALSSRLLVYERLLEPETPLLAMLLATLLFTETARTARGRLLACTFAALAVAIRPSVLPFAVVAALVNGSRAGSRREVVRQTLLFLLPLAFVSGCLAVQAGVLLGDPLAPRMNPGTVFYEGNRPSSRGVSAQYPPLVAALALEDEVHPDPAHVAFRRIARAELRDDALSISRVNRLWSGRALQFIVDWPRDAFGRFLRKVRYAFHGHAWHDVPQGYPLEERLRRLPLVPFSLLAATGLAGALLGAGRWRHDALLYALLALQFTVLVVFYVSARQQLALLPPLLVFGAGALFELFHPARPMRRKLLVAASIAALTAMFSLPDETIRKDAEARRSQSRSIAHHLAALDARSAGDLARFTSERELAIAHGARWIDQVWMADGIPVPHPLPSAESVAAGAARLLGSAIASPGGPAGPEREELVDDLATLWMAADQPDAALAVLATHASESARRTPRAAVLEARALARASRSNEAPDVLRKALDRAPGDAFLLGELAAVGDSPDSAAARASLDRYFGELDRRLVVGRALFAARRSPEAAEELGPLADAFPELRSVRLLLALSLGESGEVDEAISRLAAEAGTRIDPVVAPARTARLVARWRAAHAGDVPIERQADALLLLLGVSGDPPAPE
ncbi:MAG: hypothetical protein AB7G12_04970 [Thermoanaerobaculia bacterium]